MKLYFLFLVVGLAYGDESPSAFVALTHNFSNLSLFMMGSDPIYPGPGAKYLTQECKDNYTQILKDFKVGTRVDFRRNKLSNIWNRVLDMCYHLSPSFDDCFTDTIITVGDHKVLTEEEMSSILILTKIRRDLSYQLSIIDLMVNSHEINTQDALNKLSNITENCKSQYYMKNSEVVLKAVEESRQFVKFLRSAFYKVKEGNLKEITDKYGYPPFFQLASLCEILVQSKPLSQGEALFQVQNCQKELLL